jgi:uncharacterized membrane protein
MNEIVAKKEQELGALKRVMKWSIVTTGGLLMACTFAVITPSKPAMFMCICFVGMCFCCVNHIARFISARSVLTFARELQEHGLISENLAEQVDASDR